jgi:hypothetical protein
VNTGGERRQHGDHRIRDRLRGLERRQTLLGKATTVAAERAADGRFVPIHHLGKRALVMLSLGKDGNLVAFVLGEMCV